MPLSASRPSAARTQRFLDAQRALPFSYSPAGITLATTTPPAGYDVDHNRTELGRGRACFERACAELRRWRMFDLGWVRAADATAPIAAGTCVAILVRVAGVWSLNACRIVSAIEDRDAVGALARFGFAYGTLPGHVERGEERFTVALRTDDTVEYEILAFSQPAPVWARVARPWIRRLQRRFAHDSMLAMRRASAAGIAAGSSA